MGKHVQVRDVDDDVHAVLTRRAEEASLSLSEYLRRELARLAEKPTIDELMRRIRERRGEPAELGFSVAETLRDIRDHGE